jgi:hypothetical protein
VSITGGLLGISVTLSKMIPPEQWDAWLRWLTSFVG